MKCLDINDNMLEFWQDKEVSFEHCHFWQELMWHHHRSQQFVNNNLSKENKDCAQLLQKNIKMLQFLKYNLRSIVYTFCATFF